MLDTNILPALLRYLCPCVMVFLSLIPALVQSEPYLPENDGQVLETLSVDVFAKDSQLSKLRSQQASRPDDVTLATTLAEYYIKLGDETGDPRYFGHAQAALAFWWKEKAPNTAVLLLRAKLYEKQHDYDTALSDLHILLAAQPNSTQGWVNISNVYRVQGKYDKALEACNPLDSLEGAVLSIICASPVKAVTGQAQESYEMLEQILPQISYRSRSLVHWSITTMAEIATALGWKEKADALFREAYTQDPNDLYLIRDYTDFMLDTNRPEEVLKITQDKTNDDGILLVAAIAAKMAGQAELAQEHSSLLKARFDEIYLRGSLPHGRYESRYYLEFTNNPQRALELALVTWQKQKEVRDTRNVLEAAIEANKPAAAQPVIEFLKENKTEDVTLQKLVDQLSGDKG